MKKNLKWKIPHTVFERWILRFSSYKNRKLKVKLWWVGAPERKKWAFFVPFILFTVYILLYNIFHVLLTHSNHSNTKKPRIYDIVSSLPWLEKHLIFDQSFSSLFNLQTWVVISEMGQLGPILDLKLISFYSFFTAT